MIPSRSKHYSSFLMQTDFLFPLETTSHSIKSWNLRSNSEIILLGIATLRPVVLGLIDDSLETSLRILILHTSTI